MRSHHHASVMQDFHDDGEGGAGIKIMHLLQDSNVRNVLVIVSRWYGGILLGPARFMYITDAARGVLEQGGYLQQPRAQPRALTDPAADLAPMQESSSSDEEAEVGSSLNLCLMQVLSFWLTAHILYQQLASDPTAIRCFQIMGNLGDQLVMDKQTSHLAICLLFSFGSKAAVETACLFAKQVTYTFAGYLSLLGRCSPTIAVVAIAFAQVVLPRHGGKPSLSVGMCFCRQCCPMIWMSWTRGCCPPCPPPCSWSLPSS